MATAWCPECRGSRGVIDTHDEGEQTPAGETIYIVTELACGHHTEGPRRVLTEAPGAPFVSTEGLPVARSTKVRDLVAARGDVEVQDPWA